MNAADRKLLTAAGWEQHPDASIWYQPDTGTPCTGDDALAIERYAQRARDAHAAPLVAMVGRLREALESVVVMSIGYAHQDGVFRQCDLCDADNRDAGGEAAPIPHAPKCALAATADVGAAWTSLLGDLDVMADEWEQEQDSGAGIDAAYVRALRRCAARVRAAGERVKGGRL